MELCSIPLSQSIQGLRLRAENTIEYGQSEYYKRLVVVSPRKHAIRYQNGSKLYPLVTKLIDIEFPYQFWVNVFRLNVNTQQYIYYSSSLTFSPFNLHEKSRKQSLYSVWLPNMLSTQSICWGNASNAAFYTPLDKKDMSNHFFMIYESLWSSIFNSNAGLKNLRSESMIYTVSNYLEFVASYNDEITNPKSKFYKDHAIATMNQSEFLESFNKNI